MADKPQSAYNPETKVYSEAAIRRIFDLFSSVNIRKSSFQIQQISVLGGLCSRLLGRRTGVNEAGRLLYGIPWRNETALELSLGERLGFCLNVKAIK